MNFRKKIAIDLGTTSVLVYSRKDGVILNEPSVVAVDRFTNKVLSVGDEAKEMLGRTPGHIIAIKPLKDGVISNYDATEKMLKYFIRESVGKTLIRPDIIICVPSGATQVQKRAVRQAGINAGANEVHLIEEPLAAAIGAGIEIADSTGNMVIDIGGGTTDIAVISRGGNVTSESIRTAGDTADKCIIDYIRKTRNVIIGEKTAEDIKLSVGTVDSKLEQFEAQGRNLKTGLPDKIYITPEDIDKALEDMISEIASAVKRVIVLTPPELVSDLYENGAMMTGGGALIRGVKEKVEEKIKIPVYIASSPITSVVKGTGKALNWISKIDSLEDNQLELSRRIIENEEKLRRR